MSVNRAFAIVRAVANSIGPVSPTEIAKQIGVPRASVYRLIKTLEDERVLRHSKDRSRVELTAGFLRNMLAGASTDQIIAGFEQLGGDRVFRPSERHVGRGGAFGCAL